MGRVKHRVSSVLIVLQVPGRCWRCTVAWKRRRFRGGYIEYTCWPHAYCSGHATGRLSGATRPAKLLGVTLARPHHELYGCSHRRLAKTVAQLNQTLPGRLLTDTNTIQILHSASVRLPSALQHHRIITL